MRRILFGLWIAVSVCWIVAWSWYYHLFSCASLHDGESTDIGWHCDSSPTADGQYFYLPLPVMLAVIVGIPLALLVAGIAVDRIVLAMRQGRLN